MSGTASLTKDCTDCTLLNYIDRSHIQAKAVNVKLIISKRYLASASGRIYKSPGTREGMREGDGA